MGPDPGPLCGTRREVSSSELKGARVVFSPVASRHRDFAAGVAFFRCGARFRSSRKCFCHGPAPFCISNSSHVCRREPVVVRDCYSKFGAKSGVGRFRVLRRSSMRQLGPPPKRTKEGPPNFTCCSMSRLSSFDQFELFGPAVEAPCGLLMAAVKRSRTPG